MADFFWLLGDLAGGNKYLSLVSLQNHSSILLIPWPFLIWDMKLHLVDSNHTYIDLVERVQKGVAVLP